MTRPRQLAKKLVIMLLLLCCANMPFCCMQAKAAAQQEKNFLACIVYDSPKRFGEDLPIVDLLREYLGHFELEQRALAVEDFQQGMLQEADIVFFVGLGKENLPAEFLQEIAQAPVLVWFENGIEQITQQLGWEDFVFAGATDGWTSVVTADAEYPVNSSLDFVHMQPGAGATVLAKLKNSSAEAALGWQKNNLYYYSRIELLEQPFNWLKADFLKLVLPTKLESNYCSGKNVFLLIEDISPLSEPEKIAQIVAQATSLQVPFALSVAPAATSKGQTVYLSEKKKLVQVLQAAQQNGASIVMQGYIGENQVPGPKAEQKLKQIAALSGPAATDTLIRASLEASFLEFAVNGLYPLAFHPVEVYMEQQDLQLISEYFNILCGKLAMAGGTSASSLPYIVKSPHANGMLLLPVNLGTYDGEDCLAHTILHNAQKSGAGQAKFAGFSYHSYTQAEQLGTIIAGIKELGYTFFDLRSLPVQARSESVQIFVDGEAVGAEINSENQAKWLKTMERRQSYSLRKVGLVQINVLLLAMLSFVYLIIKLRRNANKKYEE